MTTSQIIQRVLKIYPDRTASDILELLDSLQKLLLQTENDDRLYYDTSTGDFPFIPTVAGAYDYLISIPQVWKFRAMVVNLAVYNGYGTSFPVNDAFANNPYFGRNPGTNYGFDVAQIKLNNRLYMPVPCVFKEAYQGGLPSVMFRFDPGTQATMYQVMGYTAPLQLTSTNTQLSIPVQYHETVVIPALYALLDGEDNGRYQEQLLYVEKELKPKISDSMNRNTTDNRLCFQAGGW